MDVMTQKHIYEVIIAVIVLIAYNSFCVVVRKKLIHRLIAKVCWLFVLIAGNCVILLMLLSYVITDHVLYYPHCDEEIHEQLGEMEHMEELALETSVGKCGGWFYHSPKNSELTVILYPGNMQTAGEMVLLSGTFEDSAEGLGLNLVVMDYPGYGNSEGLPSEYTMKKMALEAYDGVVSREDMKKQKVVLMSYSIGTGVANYIASQRDVDGLILLAPYQNGYDLFNGFVDIFHGPMKLFMPFRMRADEFAKLVTIKPLVIASEQDEMVPYESSLALTKLYPMGVDMKSYKGLAHGELWQEKQIWLDIFSYLRDIYYS